MSSGLAVLMVSENTMEATWIEAGYGCDVWEVIIKLKNGAKPNVPEIISQPVRWGQQL